MTTFMEEMKQQSQSNLENLREKGKPRQEVASKLERHFLTNSRGSILRTYKKLLNFTAHICRQRLDTFLL